MIWNTFTLVPFFLNVSIKVQSMGLSLGGTRHLLRHCSIPLYGLVWRAPKEWSSWWLLTSWIWEQRTPWYRWVWTKHIYWASKWVLLLLLGYWFFWWDNWNFYLLHFQRAFWLLLHYSDHCCWFVKNLVLSGERSEISAAPVLGGIDHCSLHSHLEQLITIHQPQPIVSSEHQLDWLLRDRIHCTGEGHLQMGECSFRNHKDMLDELVPEDLSQISITGSHFLVTVDFDLTRLQRRRHGLPQRSNHFGFQVFIIFNQIVRASPFHCSFLHQVHIASISKTEWVDLSIEIWCLLSQLENLVGIWHISICQQEYFLLGRWITKLSYLVVKDIRYSEPSKRIFLLLGRLSWESCEQRFVDVGSSQVSLEALHLRFGPRHNMLIVFEALEVATHGLKVWSKAEDFKSASNRQRLEENEEGLLCHFHSWSFHRPTAVYNEDEGFLFVLIKVVLERESALIKLRLRWVHVKCWHKAQHASYFFRMSGGLL